MRAAIFSPYATNSAEEVFTALLANYIRHSVADVSQLGCRGSFSSCGRDRIIGAARDPLSCLRCHGAQTRLTDWSGVDLYQIGAALTPEAITNTRRFINELPIDQLPLATFRGYTLYDLAGHEIFSRCHDDQPNLQDARDVTVVRESLLNAARMILATERFLQEQKPQLCIVSRGDDILTRPFIEVCLTQSVQIITIRSEQQESKDSPDSLENSEIIRAFLLAPSNATVGSPVGFGNRSLIGNQRANLGAVANMSSTLNSKSSGGKIWSCEFSLKDVNQLTTMLPESPDKWPTSVAQTLEDLLLSFGLVDPQIPLPIAQ